MLTIKPEYGVNYKAGQVYFTYDDESLISNGIAWFTFKDGKEKDKLKYVSHCGICVGKNLGISAQGEKDKFDYEDLEKLFYDSNKRIFFKEPTKLDMLGSDGIVNLSKKYLGTKYNFKLATGFAFVNSFLCRSLVPKKYKKRILESFDDKGKLLCSQAVAMLTCLSGMHNDFDYLKTPHEIFEHKMFKSWKG